MRVSDIGGVNVSVNLGGNNFNKNNIKKMKKIKIIQQIKIQNYLTKY
ncbi:hypothetical protein ACF60L_11105 [Clostridium perfringens]